MDSRHYDLILFVDFYRLLRFVPPAVGGRGKAPGVHGHAGGFCEADGEALFGFCFRSAAIQKRQGEAVMCLLSSAAEQMDGKEQRRRTNSAFIATDRGDVLTLLTLV